MKPLVLSAVLLLAGCHADRLRPVDDGYEIRSRATVPQAQEAALAVARELGHPARVREGAVHVEMAKGPPMSERPSQWLRVSAVPRGAGTVTTVRLLPEVAVLRRSSVPRRSPVGTDAYTYADLLNDRLGEIR